jgi:tetratricopeptide (TPR) repeat protein
MTPLDYPDDLRLRAAQGWLELGNCSEARAELQSVSAAARQHQDVLELRWQIAVKEQHWEEGVLIAGTLCQLAPDKPFGWIHRSYCLHELKRTREAWEMLLPVATRFPREWLICYNLACYACQLQQLDEAQHWLNRALEIGNPNEIKKLAAKDPDLKPLFGSKP